jgi:ribonuclease Z
MNLTKTDTTTYKTYTITGTSVAALGTCIYIKELRLAFDMGILIDNWVHNTDTVCISHGHCDHIGQLHTHSIRRQFFDSATTPTYIVPKYCIDNFNTLYKAVSGMNVGSYTLPVKQYEGNHYKLLTAESILETKHEFRKNFFIQPIKLAHKILDYGYAVIEKRTKLKQEYLSLSGKEIAIMKKEGADIFYDIITTLFAFTGDTCLDAVVASDLLMNSKVLILECTYVDDSVTKEAAKKMGHVHLYSIKENEDKFKNEVIILIHFSQLHTKAQVTEAINKNLSEEFRKKIVLFTAGLL